MPKRRPNRHTPRQSGKHTENSAHYWLYGWHSVTAALANPEREAHRLVVTANSMQRLEEEPYILTCARKIGIEKVGPDGFASLLPRDAVHQGIALQVAPLPDATLEDLMESEASGPILILDQITDPHNVGAIIRSAAAFDAKGVVVQDRHSAPQSAILAKSAAGGMEVMPVARETNLANCIKSLKNNGFWIAGLDGHATDILGKSPLPTPLALILGAEGSGLRRLTAELCDLSVCLPISPAMESLNVSNAAAIALYECYKEAKS